MRNNKIEGGTASAKVFLLAIVALLLFAMPWASGDFTIEVTQDAGLLPDNTIISSMFTNTRLGSGASLTNCTLTDCRIGDGSELTGNVDVGC